MKYEYKLIKCLYNNEDFGFKNNKDDYYKDIAGYFKIKAVVVHVGFMQLGGVDKDSPLFVVHLKRLHGFPSFGLIENLNEKENPEWSKEKIS